MGLLGFIIGKYSLPKFSFDFLSRNGPIRGQRFKWGFRRGERKIPASLHGIFDLQPFL